MKIEIPVGTVIIYDDNKLRCVEYKGERIGIGDCMLCYFGWVRCDEYACSATERKDKRNVYFAEVKNADR